jgi:hypothetical protein
VKIREGVIPAGLGTVVTAAGATLAALKVAPVVSAGIAGFGLAHMVLGAIDLIQNRKEQTEHTEHMDRTEKNQIVALSEFS